MSQYIQVAEEEGDEPMEVPVEEDGTLLLTTLAAQFPGSCGLKYRNPDSGSMRGIRLSDGRLYPPDCDWGRYVFIAVFPKAESKRKVDEPWDNIHMKKRVEKQRCSDLIVLGLPWKSTEDDLRKYFSQFGDLLMVQVKKDPKTGQSKGFGFVRFAEYESQVKCISQRHMIDGRWCDVRIPNSKVDVQEGAQQMMNRKVFVGRCTEDMTAEDLRLHFSRYGEVVDVFIPKPFRAFAFVTFADPEVAQNLCGEDHIIKGASVHISGAAPKNNEKHPDRRPGLNHTPFGFSQAYPPGAWGPAAKGNSQGITSQGTSMGTNLSNNLGLGNLGLGALQLNHAMLAAAQAVLSSQGGWGPLGLTNQGGSASSGDNPTPNHASANSSFGTVGNGTTSSGGGGGFLGWGGSQSSDGPSHSPGHMTGWGAQTKAAGTGWN